MKPSLLPQINMASIDPAKQARETATREKETPALAYACLLLTSLAGAALLVWWATQFHPDNRQLWMVPLGLILTGTPVVVWFALSASDVWRSLLVDERQDEARKREVEVQCPEK